MGRFDNVKESILNSKRGKEQFNISELARIFNITSETLRKYEKKNIIEPLRLENSYRVYSSWEITKVIRARQLRMEGNSLIEVDEHLHGINIEESVKRIEKRKDELEKQLFETQKLLSWLQKRKEEMHQYNKKSNDIRIEKMSSLYCCVYMVGNTLTNKTGEQLAELQKWLEALPYVSVYYVGTDKDHTVSCVAITEEERKEYHLDYLVPDFIIPETEYVMFNDYAQHNLEVDTSNDTITNGLEKAREVCEQIDDVFVIKMIDYIQKDGLYSSFNIMMYPIKK